jgi:outer membrane lipoprotein-sorting protein
VGSGPLSWPEAADGGEAKSHTLENRFPFCVLRVLRGCFWLFAWKFVTFVARLLQSLTSMGGAGRFSGVPGEEMAKFRVMRVCGFSGERHRARAAAFLVLLAASGCGVKTEVKVPVAPKIAAAKTATLQELLAILQGYRAKITTLSSRSVKVSLTVAQAESGKAQVYHSAPGYILLRQPDDMLLNIQVPLTKTTAVELLSRGDRFELWSPRDNKLYVGRNSAQGFELEENGQALAFTARPVHIIEAILPHAASLSRQDARIAKTEEQDAQAKYYVLTLYQETGSAELRVLRRLWIERSQMVLAKDETFTESGQIAGTVRYSDQGTFDGMQLPREILIDRPLDGYSLGLHFSDWRINPNLEDSAFVLNPPPDARRIILKEKDNGHREFKGAR